VFEELIKQFFEKYGDDPVGFVRDVLHVEPDPWQAQVLGWIGSGERRCSIKSGHGVGKSACASWAMIWHLLTKYPQKTVVTAPTVSQLHDALGTECKRWINELPDAFQSQIEVLSEQIRLKGAPSESFISFRVSRVETPEALAGIHSEHVLLVVDEASGVPEQIYEASGGSMSGSSATTLLLGNPVRSSGFFHSTHTRLSKYWKTTTVSCIDSERVTDDYIEDMKIRYGEDTNPWRVRVLGEFPFEDEDTIVPRDLIEASINRDVKVIEGPVVMGVDIARRGGDSSAICVRQNNHIIGNGVMTKKGFDLMQVVGWIREEIENVKKSGIEVSEVLIDSIGLGAGVVDRLLEEGIDVRGVNVGESSSISTEFWNLRAELWWKCREWFAKKDVLIPRDERLVEELASVRRLWPSNGKLQVEPKDQTRQRLGRNTSPDAADALILTFASYASMTTGKRSWKEPLERKTLGIV